MTPPIPIDDPADPRVQAYWAVRERDLVGREGMFIAEGEVVLKVLLGCGRHRPLSLLIDAGRLGRLAGVLATLDEEVPVYAAGRAVLDAIAGFPLHRGILALARRGPALSADEVLGGAGGEGAIVVVAFGIGNHDNLGGIFRNAAAFGAEAILLDPFCCDPLYRKAIRVSVGASLTVPFARIEAGTDILALLAAHRFAPLALSPAGRDPLARLVRPPRAAVLLGSEGPGLPAAVLAGARTVSIPMSGGFDSLNVATTSGIVLHHLVSQTPPPRGGGWGGDGAEGE